MFFTEKEKQIFSIEGSDQRFDPLAIDRAIRKESGNRFSKILETWKASDTQEGDISEDGRYKTILASDEAEVELARIARAVFYLPNFPDCTDGVALEYLCQYLDWCKKKEMKGIIVPECTTSEEAYNFINYGITPMKCS